MKMDIVVSFTPFLISLIFPLLFLSTNRFDCMCYREII